MKKTVIELDCHQQHSYIAVDVTPRMNGVLYGAMGAGMPPNNSIIPTYKLYCQKCGITKKLE